MQRAMDETDRRRTKQVEYNKAHGITPKGIVKAVADIMEGARSGAPGTAKRFAKVADEMAEYAELSPGKLARKLSELEARMYKHAENLEFEQAAKLRDDITRLRGASLQLPQAVTASP